MTWVRVFL